MVCGQVKKTTFFLGCLWIFVGSIRGQEAAYVFDRTSHDFGAIRRNENVRTVFTLTNTGTVPLIVLDVRVPCDCVRIDWPRQPVPAGGSAALTVAYKDRNTGAFYKQIEIVTTGTPRTSRITLKGNVR